MNNNANTPPRVLDTPREGPVDDLVLAMNFYVSTGNHIGEGVVMGTDDGDGKYIFVVPYDPQNPDDRADANRLRIRLGEITDALTGMHVEIQNQTLPGKFKYLMIFVSPSDCRKLAAELVRHCGSAGWGTSKPLIDEHFPNARAKILSGEGV